MRAGMLLAVMGLVWIGCNGDDGDPSETGTEPVGACGDVTSFDLTIVGRVRDVDENWVPDVALSLEERNWDPGTVHGTAESDSEGRFTFGTTQMPVVAGCWGTAVQYWLVGSTSTLSGEKPMNALFQEAFDSGAQEVDLGAFPLILY